MVTVYWCECQGWKSCHLESFCPQPLHPGSVLPSGHATPPPTLPPVLMQMKEMRLVEGLVHTGSFRRSKCVLCFKKGEAARDCS